MNSLSLASQGLLNPGKDPALAIAAQGFLVTALSRSRGDDAGGSRPRRQQIIIIRRLEEVADKVRELPKPKKKRAKALRYIAENLDEIVALEPDFAVEIAPFQIELAKPEPMLSAAQLMAIAAQIEAQIAANEKRLKRKRDEAALMLLM